MMAKLIKKNKFLPLILGLFAFVTPLFAEETAEQIQVEATEASESEKTEDENQSAIKEKKTKKSKKSKNSANAKKNYAGWIDTSGKDINFQSGIVQLRVRPKLGTFNISVVTEEGKTIPVLSTANEFTTSGFYLKSNKKAYKLGAELNIKTAARKVENGIELSYSIDKVADVFLSLNCLESAPGNGIDMVKITSTVVNRSTKKATFAQKLILDTVLGETNRYHFYSREDVPIQSEVMYRTMKNEKYFISKNSYASMQILLDGADISPIDSVSLANYSTLNQNTWEPEMLSYRSFDTVLSYNNSAVGIIWPEKTIGVNGKKSDTFYLAFSEGEKRPLGYTYIMNKPATLKKEPSEELTRKVTESIGEETKEPVRFAPSVEVITANPEPVQPVKIQKEVNTLTTPKTVVEAASVNPQPENKEEVISTPKVEEKIQEEPKKVEEIKSLPVKENLEPKVVPNVKFDVSTLTQEQLTPEYIQKLLDKILALEENDANLNREELLKLNAELDAILESLR